MLICRAVVAPQQQGPELVPSLKIFSQFQRIDPFGNIVSADRSPHPREILSPAVPRNAYATFHVAVTLPPGKDYLLYVATNPSAACRVELYKEHFVQSGGSWIPDTLTRVNRVPDFGVMPDPDERILGQNTRVYLLDLWIPPDADLKGFRLEVQLKVGYFLVAPMEMRVLEARVPAVPTDWNDKPMPLPDVGDSADAAAMGPMRQYFSVGRAAPVGAPLTLRGVLARNAMQDVAYAASLDPQQAGPEVLKRFCDAMPRNQGAEWYLRFRDYLYGHSSHQ
jgi:hypothetical protein